MSLIPIHCQTPMDLKEPGTREMSLEHVYGDAGGLGWFQFRHIVVMSLIKGLVSDKILDTGMRRNQNGMLSFST